MNCATNPMDLTYAISLTVPDIYDGKSIHVLATDAKAAGYRIVGFRPPCDGETFFSRHRNAEEYPIQTFAANKYPPHEPRLILEKAQKRKRYIFEETGEEPRLLCPNEAGIYPHSGETMQLIIQQRSSVTYKGGPKYTPLKMRVEEF